MVLPFKGIDRSIVHALMPSGSTDRARDVRLRDPRSGKRGLFRRAPYTKLFTAKVGDTTVSGATHINHLTAIPKRGAGASSPTGMLVTTTEDFKGRYMRATGNGSELSTDLAGFRRDYITGSPDYVSIFWRHRVQHTDLAGVNDTVLETDANGGLIVDWLDAAAYGGYPGVAVQYPCKGDVTTQMYAAGTASTTANGAGNTGEPHGYGPFIRGSTDLSQYIGACLLRTGANKVKLSIVKVDGSTRTTLVQSDELTLDATAWGSGVTQTAADLFIRIYEEGGNIRAICGWETQGVGMAAVPGDLGGGSPLLVPAKMPDSSPTVVVPEEEPTTESGDDGIVGPVVTVPVPESAGTVLTCSTSTTSFAGNTRAGMCALFTSGGSGSAADKADRWYIRSITYTKIVPPDPNVLNQCDRNSRPFSPARYFIPLGCNAVGITTAGVQTQSGQGWSAPEDDLTGITHPYIDEAYPVVKGNTAALRSSFVGISPLDPSYSARYQVETKGRVGALIGLDSGTDTDDIAGAMLRSYTDYKTCILLEVYHGSGFAAPDPYMNLTRQDSWTELRVVGLVNGARYVLETYSASGTHFPPFRSDAYQRWEDGGQTTLAAMVITWKINGIAVKVLPAIASMTGYAAFDAALTSADGSASGVRRTYMNTSKLCGIAFRGDDAPPPNFYTWGGRIIGTEAEQASSRTLGDDTSTLVAFTPGRVTVGPLSGGAPTILGTNLLWNAGVQTAYLGVFLYATDGAEYRYFDVSQSVLAGMPSWTAATAGTIPPRCRLIASWRASIVLARPDSDTTAWFISRQMDPFDWDFDADPPETTALAGTTTTQGQPAQPIVALIPWTDDILVMACTGQMLAMVGDPRTGGQLVIAEPNVGIIGPNAWCIDDSGSLWFMAPHGLYRKSPGGLAVNVDKGRMGDILNSIDASKFMVRMAWNPLEGCIYIFLTNVDTGVACVHVVYDVGADAFVEDRYDNSAAAPEMNPWACCVPLSSIPEERVLHIGGSDGWVRRMNVDANEDERESTTAPIASSVDIYMPDSAGTSEVMVEKLRVEGDLDSDAVTLRWFTADGQAALAEMDVGDEVFSQSCNTDGYQTPISVRRTGAGHKLRIEQNTANGWFGIERIAVLVDTRGRRR